MVLEAGSWGARGEKPGHLASHPVNSSPAGETLFPGARRRRHPRLLGGRLPATAALPRLAGAAATRDDKTHKLVVTLILHHNYRNSSFLALFNGARGCKFLHTMSMYEEEQLVLLCTSLAAAAPPAGCSNCLLAAPPTPSLLLLYLPKG